MAKTIYGGNEPIEVTNNFINKNWHMILIIIIVLVVLFLFMKEQFLQFDLPYTSGAGIRVSSIDSATNRGHAQLERMMGDMEAPEMSETNSELDDYQWGRSKKSEDFGNFRLNHILMGQGY